MEFGFKLKDSGINSGKFNPELGWFCHEAERECHVLNGVDWEPNIGAHPGHIIYLSSILFTTSQEGWTNDWLKLWLTLDRGCTLNDYSHKLQLMPSFTGLSKQALRCFHCLMSSITRFNGKLTFFSGCLDLQFNMNLCKYHPNNSITYLKVQFLLLSKVKMDLTSLRWAFAVIFLLAPMM